MAQTYHLRAAGHKYNIGRGKEERPRQDEVWKETVVTLCPSWDEME
jgi:hypothetical protein